MQKKTDLLTFTAGDKPARNFFKPVVNKKKYGLGLQLLLP